MRQANEHGAGPTSSQNGDERPVITLSDVEGHLCQGSGEYPNDSAEADSYGNVHARPATSGAQRHNKHGEHRFPPIVRQ
jgi:hypothetical protein